MTGAFCCVSTVFLFLQGNAPGKKELPGTGGPQMRAPGVMGQNTPQAIRC